MRRHRRIGRYPGESTKTKQQPRMFDANYYFFPPPYCLMYAARSSTSSRSIFMAASSSLFLTMTLRLRTMKKRTTKTAKKRLKAILASATIKAHGQRKIAPVKERHDSSSIDLHHTDEYRDTGLLPCAHWHCCTVSLAIALSSEELDY